MPKVVIVKVKAKKSTPKSVSVAEKRVRDSGSGKFLTMRKIDGKSQTLGKDLIYVFGKNVAKARRENKQVTGALDRVPAKA